MDPSDPTQRYKLITIGNFGGTQKAFVRDGLKRVTRLIKVGESIGDCKLVEILSDEKAIRLKPTEGTEFKVLQPAR